ncbi:unnamed protein product [Protopolystoma xenopodis]|uniref:Uncharacterized protein n=1 Tax=Protopolystoma xenopodis TaxID=117903 RepID=A0A3S5B4U0_9PLAT|nr:unnamed protein product [Protopolystoma xenopodis]
MLRHKLRFLLDTYAHRGNRSIRFFFVDDLLGEYRYPSPYFSSLTTLSSDKKQGLFHGSVNNIKICSSLTIRHCGCNHDENIPLMLAPKLGVNSGDVKIEDDESEIVIWKKDASAANHDIKPGSQVNTA